VSTGPSLRHADALALAKHLVDDLNPLVQRCKVAGSLRRRRPLVSDIEIVAEPRLVTADLFGGTAPDVAPIRRLAESWGTVVKGGEKYIQVEHVLGVGGVKLDLFLVTPPANFWVILAIRTGPANLGQEAVTRMHHHGRRCVEGRIVDRAGQPVPCSSEEDFFAAAGLPCLPPLLRDTRDALRPLVNR
jgi:DNA polymerase/3'-5' exonuclease PolX